MDHDDDDGTEQMFELVLSCLEKVPTKEWITNSIGNQAAVLGARIDVLRKEFDLLKNKELHADCSAKYSMFESDINKLREEVDLSLQSLEKKIG